jgi:simple sugar transport system permease protein
VSPRSHGLAGRGGRAGARPSAPPFRPLAAFLSSGYINTLAVFVALVLVFYLFTPNHIFLHPRNLRAITKLIPELGIVTLGIGMLMICGEFDLSIASTLPLSTYVFISLLRVPLNPFAALVVVLLVGASLGLANGLITVRGGIPSFITTLGTLMFWRGFLYVFTKMMPIDLRAFLPAGTRFEGLFLHEVGGVVPAQMLWFGGIAVLLGLLLHRHRFGNWVYATGGNRLAARAMGIDTDAVKTACFMIVGALGALSGVMETLRLESFYSTQGKGYELKAIAACVVGGAFLAGGRGGMFGILLGVLVIELLENGLILMRVPVFGISAFIGVAVILFVLLNSFIDRKRMLARSAQESDER